MSAIKQLHKELVRAIKLGFLLTYLVRDVSWEGGVAVAKTKHVSVYTLHGPEIHIPAPTSETIEEIKYSLSEGV